MVNPFTPTFGAPPPLLVGRRDLLDLFEDAVGEGPGSPGYVTLYTGGRGVGKTVMLNAAEDVAAAAGFAVVSETATPGFLERIATSHLPELLPKSRRKVKAATIASVGGVELETSAARTRTLRALVEEVTRTRPVLITLDELHQRTVSELAELMVVLQHAIRESRHLALCAAGLPSAIDELLGHDGVTFIRRADRHVLGAVPLHEVRQAFREVVAESGRTITETAAEAAAQATGGFPFLVQLVGYHAWRQRPNRKAITVDDVAHGADAAARRVGRLVIEPALNDLSAVDRTFLLHMAVDDGPSRMKSIARRLGVDANYASQYRLRLIAAGLIEPAGHGMVMFTLPVIREWLRDHAAFHTVMG